MPQVKRQWRPFAEAREYVQSLGFKKQKDFEAWSKGGSRPADIPGSPAKAYGPLWEGWADFLGTGTARPRRVCRDGEFRPYPEARAYVRTLGLGSQRAYAAWSRTEDRPADIPANPYNAYGNEWPDWADWAQLGDRGITYADVLWLLEAYQIARLVMGNGRWGPDDLAREIECSPRTIFRDVEVLAASGIPIVYDKAVQAYRVRDGFRFSGLDPHRVAPCDPADPAVRDLLVNARRVLKDAEAFLGCLRRLCDQLEAIRPPGA